MTQFIWLYKDVFMVYYLLYKQCYDVSVNLFLWHVCKCCTPVFCMAINWLNWQLNWIHWWPMDPPHKWPVMQKTFPCYDVTMYLSNDLVDSFIVSLHSANSKHLPVVMAACAGDCQWPLENVGNSHQSRGPEFIATDAFLNLYLDQPITKRWCQPVGGHAPFHTESPNATRLGLMMTSSNGNIFRVTGPMCGEFTGHRWPVMRSFDFSFICAWINAWVNDHKVGDLIRHRTHYDVTVMCVAVYRP